MIYPWLICSAVFLLGVSGMALARRRAGIGEAAVCCLAFAFVLFCISEVLALNALLLAVAGAVCWAFEARPRWYILSAVGATVAAYAVVGGAGVREWQQVQKDNPPVSLAPRLAYEDRPRSVPQSEGVGPATEDRLAALEAHVGDYERGYPAVFRTRSLELVHAGVVRQFINSPGFGVSRLPRPSPYFVRPDYWEETPAPQPIPPYPPADLAPAPLRAAAGSDLPAAHEYNTLDFLDPARFGFVRDREHVIGFRPHRFREAPRDPPRWRINRLELVSLLKYDEPAAYLSSNFPRMDELSDAPTRPLDGFEKEALAKLRGGEDLIVQEAPKQMRMLGSLRAVQQCLRCHEVRRGELLGAFSYQMRLAENSAP
ncbi:MAG TPA: hypothetical protein VJ739_13275, partial [Gemmataceae bacterium]|nr:hypothetical protein [Gemmataceae bacterium]